MERLALASILPVVTAQMATPLIMGIGPGLFGLIVVFLFCVLLCLCGYSSENRCGLLGIVGVIIAATVVFLVTVKVTAPGQSLVRDQEYNNKGLTRSFVRAILIAFSAVALASLLVTHVIKPRQVMTLTLSSGRFKRLS
ncbi:hypothetical protein ACHHYP_09775 [Achlya hypogyna]|uniref:Transmembrane protein n=1 Tax=Achlya hypogyna TaxID=1202772 RepID=A0A1V9YMF9_ACHHY|nr:hypothetical protein ACHHYP_09775 [Achlya hypogyna]